MSWEAESLQAVLFHIPSGETPDALQPWLSVFKSPPQNFQTNRPGAPPGGTASGLVGSYQMLLSAGPGRLDLVMASPPTRFGPPAGIRDIEQALAALALYLKELLKSSPANRIAFVVQLVQQVASSREAAEVFANETKLPSVPLDALDLAFALNVRRAMKDSSRTMNRLCKWGTTIQQLVDVKITIGSGEPSLGVQEFPAATLQIDVNTVPTEKGEDFDVTGGLADELAEELREILKGGYDYLVS